MKVLKTTKIIIFYVNEKMDGGVERVMEDWKEGWMKMRIMEK